MRRFVSIVAVVLMIPMVVPRIHAQQAHTAPQAQMLHTAPQAAIDAALRQHVAAESADRASILRVLGHPEVKAVAERAGLDLRRATDAVATLDPTELAQVAAQAQQVDDALAGGQSRITISTTLIIIVLLIIILIIVAVD